MLAQNKPTIIYVGDPMCSWCYGFGSEFDAAMSELSPEVDLEVVMGGLRPYNKEVMVDMKDFLSSHWKDVNDKSGKPFNYGILDTNIPYDTEPASRAVVVVRSMKEDLAMPYFHKAQHGFYFDNHDPMDVSSFAKIAVELGLDEGEFRTKFLSEEFKKMIKQDFLRASQLGVRSFPTVLLSHNGEVDVVASGYTTSDKIITKVRSLLK